MTLQVRDSIDPKDGERSNGLYLHLFGFVLRENHRRRLRPRPLGNGPWRFGLADGESLRYGQFQQVYQRRQ